MLDTIDIVMLTLVIINTVAIAYFLTILLSPKYPKPRIQLVAVATPLKFATKKPMYDTKILPFDPKKRKIDKKEKK